MFLHRNFLNGATCAELEDVQRNLQNVLSTKQGCGSFLRGFGLSETGYRTPEQMLVDLSKEIRESITRYEPRVEITEIEEVYSETGRASLIVHCRLRSSRELLQIGVDPASRTLTIESPREP